LVPVGTIDWCVDAERVAICGKPDAIIRALITVITTTANVNVGASILRVAKVDGTVVHIIAIDWCELTASGWITAINRAGIAVITDFLFVDALTIL